MGLQHVKNGDMAASPPSQRSILVGVPAPDDQYPSNAVKTAVYTPYNFLPKNLFKQFTRFSNLYFLFIMVLQLLPDVTFSIGVPTMVLPLAFIIFVSGVRDAMEDVERHRADRLQNLAPVCKMRFPAPSSSSAQALTFATDVCESLRIGELVRVSQNEEIPADMVPIASSASASGQCFVMTANLDGESSLKPRYVPHALCGEPYAACFSSDGQNAKAAALTHIPAIRVVCEPPNGRIDKFRGGISFADDGSAMLDISNVLFRGTHFKDTA